MDGGAEAVAVAVGRAPWGLSCGDACKSRLIIEIAQWVSRPVLSCLVFALFRFYAIVNRETSEKNQARVAQAAKKNVCELRLSLLVGQ